jgi:single-stranded-DNA-specific exonuclease
MATRPTLVLRDAPPRVVWALEQAGVHPLLARLYAGRGVRSPEELDDAVARLLAPDGLRGAIDAARLLADAIERGERICIVADYDCDGATACAVALRGLALLGAARDRIGYVVPDRAVHGYGLTPAIVDLALAQRPAVLVTVDNGIASLEGVAHARAHGVAVVVTDHHLPARDTDDAIRLPEADVIVNPNQPGCAFASKHLAGVGVMFYVLLALRAERRRRGAFTAESQPRLDALLDLVALGTVADVVRLDANNRRLVAQGLRRMRAGRLHPGLAALFAAAGRDVRRASAFDLGFAIGPRVNAAGRLADMTLGIECLVTDDAARAAELAHRLDAINRERRELETGMREQAEALLERLMPQGEPPPALALYDAGFHEGVIGIVASRLKDRVHRPTFVFARGRDGLLKGSGRSIVGFHLRDALDLVSKRHAGVLLRFGGHAMAAGCTVEEAAFPVFEAALRTVAAEWLDASALERELQSDGPLPLEHFHPTAVRAIEAAVWGQAFEAPLFSDEVEVLTQRLVGDKHLKLGLRLHGVVRDAIWFGRTDPLGARARIAYRLSLDEYEGRERVQMVVEALLD